MKIYVVREEGKENAKRVATWLKQHLDHCSLWKELKEELNLQDALRAGIEVCEVEMEDQGKGEEFESLHVIDVLSTTKIGGEGVNAHDSCGENAEH